MEETPFKRFINLIAYDQETYSEQQALAALEKEITVLQQHMKKCEEQYAIASDEVKMLRREVDAKELEMKALDIAERETRTKLDSAENQKMYWALKKEIESLKAKQHAFEEVLLQVWRDLELAERKYKEQGREREQTMQKLQQDITEKEKEAAQKKENLEKRLSERVQKEHGVPEEWLEKYTRMQAQIVDPVAAVTNNSCGACFTIIPPQEVLILKRRVLLQCKGCYRLLYDASMSET